MGGLEIFEHARVELIFGRGCFLDACKLRLLVVHGDDKVSLVRDEECKAWQFRQSPCTEHGLGPVPLRRGFAKVHSDEAFHPQTPFFWAVRNSTILIKYVNNDPLTVCWGLPVRL